MLTKLTHLTLFVHNQEEALSFYKKLGFSIHTDAQFGAMRWLTINLPEQKDVEIALMKPENDLEVAIVGKQTVNKPLFSLESNDCRKDYEKLKDLGINFVQEPSDEPWGISMALVDLYGNMIYVCQHKE